MTELDKILFKKKLKEWKISLIYGAIILIACTALYFIFFYHVHSFSDWQMVVEPSCNKYGVERCYCSCGEFEQRTVDKLQHTDGEWIINEERSERQLLCSVCDFVLDSEPYIPHTHSFSEWIVTLESKCEEKGRKERKCECGEIETMELEALGHTEGNWTLEGITKYFSCTNCDILLRTEELEASKGLLIEDGVLLGLGMCTDSEIILPKNITEIGRKAFEYNDTVKSIYFPENIRVIGDKAFYNCTALERVVFSSGLESIGEQAFYGCISLEEVDLPDTLISLDARAFSYCDKLKKISLPSSVYIEMWCFASSERLSSIYFDGTVAEWEALPKDSEWNMYTNKYTIYCTDGNIEK